MKLSIEPLGPEHEASAAAFNRRLQAVPPAPPFLLPERGRTAQTDGVTVTDYVAVDGGGAVRGGFLAWEHPAVVGTTVRSVMNIQSPLSEGTMDRAFVMVGPRMIQAALDRSPMVYVVGMGSEANPLPRLLKALGFTVREVPFFFRMLRAARCVRQLGPLRDSAWKRLAGDLAAFTGVASLAAAAAHRAREPVAYELEEVAQWGDWADSVWAAFARNVSFGSPRDGAMGRFYYPLRPDTPRVWKLIRAGVVEGWFGLLISPMIANPYFGNLTVATLTDCVGPQAALAAGCVHAVAKARELGADLLITNQAHQAVRQSCLAAGYRKAPSNFLFAASKALAAGIEAESIYVTRRDGDGLVNLIPQSHPARTPA